MLSADMVHTRRRGDRLLVVPLAPEDRPRALELAAAYLDLARAQVGQTRGALLEACRAVDVQPAEQRLARGLLKLVLDGCTFEENAGLDAVELRRALFSRATRARQSGTFDRARVLGDEAVERQGTVEGLETALFADLPDAHKLAQAQLPSPEGLLARHHLAQQQAVLLRAQSVHATIWNATPAATRDLFRKLKFLRLLVRIEALPKRAGYRLEIDGPYSLFESVTKYGLQLALALPSLMACDRWAFEADVRWGKDRRPLRFGLRGGRDTTAQATPAEDAHLPDEVAALLRDLSPLSGPWRPAASQAILDLPGVGQCVPDLEFVHQETGQTAYLEVLGFWSREAVWKRVELAERGLPYPVLFAVSKHLRVSEAALGPDLPAALYVYARSMSASAVMQKIGELASRPCA